MKTAVLLIALVGVCCGQRPSYAGRNPVGYPSLDPITTTRPAAGSLGDRFGNDVAATTQKLPVEANGDASLVQSISQLPEDQQPFWYLNWRAYEQMRERPQTYQIRGNEFIDRSSAPTRRF